MSAIKQIALQMNGLDQLGKWKDLYKLYVSSPPLCGKSLSACKEITGSIKTMSSIRCMGGPLYIPTSRYCTILWFFVEKDLLI